MSISSKMNSLVDSVLSLTIGDQIKNERKALNTAKLDALRKSTVGNRKVNLIKPSRPDRKGLNSEIIIEKKLAHGKSRTNVQIQNLGQLIFCSTFSS